jgi:hypothetical protein
VTKAGRGIGPLLVAGVIRPRATGSSSFRRLDRHDAGDGPTVDGDFDEFAVLHPGQHRTGVLVQLANRMRSMGKLSNRTFYNR